LKNYIHRMGQVMCLVIAFVILIHIIKVVFKYMPVDMVAGRDL
jgi:hypothetical protein